MSMFKNAQPIAETKKKSGKAEKEVVSITGLEDYAQVDALLKALEGVKKSLEQEIKAQGMEIFFNKIAGRKPENFRAEEGQANASFEFRKRTSRSELSEDEINMFKHYGVTVGEEELSREMFGINPAYASNEQLLGRVEAALKDIVPADFIVLQPKRVKYIVSDETVDTAFRLGCPKEVIEAVTTLAVKPKLQDTNLGKVIDHVRKLLGLQQDEVVVGDVVKQQTAAEFMSGAPVVEKTDA